MPAPTQEAAFERALGRVEGKLDLILANQDRFDRGLRRLDTRVDTLEHAKTKLLAYASAASGVFAIIWSVASNYLSKYFT